MKYISVERIILIIFPAIFVLVSGMDLGFEFEMIKDIISEGTHDIFKHLKSKFSCKMCTDVAKFMKEKRLAMKDDKREFSDEDIGDLLITICSELHANTKPVCTGLIRLNIPIVMDIMVNNNLDECRVCQTVFEYLNCCKGGPAVPWNLDLKKYGDKPKDCSKFPGPGRKTTKIAHITDTHWDQSYVVGSSNDCNEPICCRSGGDMPKEKKKQAKKFGSYHKCDIPFVTIESTLQNIKDQHGKDLAFIVVTGDFVEHNIWETTPEQVEKSIKDQTEAINKIFPDTPIFYSIGNHDMHPTNQFADPNKTDYTNWLYKLFVDHWTNSLDDGARETIAKGGFYTYQVKDGPRIISMNSMYCYILNWWLIEEPIDPAGQLIWLADTLNEAEKNGEMVYIIQHISVGTIDCLTEYSREFWRILTRYQCIIKALLTGHVHLDETRLIYDIDDISKPIISVHNGGSITAYDEVNVNYKIYEADTQSWDILNAESWIFNLAITEENAKWFKLYSFKDEFKVESTKPEELDKAVKLLANDQYYMKKYNWYYAKGANTSMSDGCDERCLRTRLCDIVTTNYTDQRKCDEI